MQSRFQIYTDLIANEVRIPQHLRQQGGILYHMINHLFPATGEVDERTVSRIAEAFGRGLASAWYWGRWEGQDVNTLTHNECAKQDPAAITEMQEALQPALEPLQQFVQQVAASLPGRLGFTFENVARNTMRWQLNAMRAI